MQKHQIKEGMCRACGHAREEHSKLGYKGQPELESSELIGNIVVFKFDGVISGMCPVGPLAYLGKRS